ncbi:hypothetical protein FB45DRAFT_451702 [Roridomyces roridus]|uniref:ubiquitinyl hydrolase 1 n=1 Tax=Roridomyces roridus TaxID=1738132 RepID=A0AAD7FSN0_9AGAR|nr:hypothetical protein FB45DRAFT_451702 [Roridomyces roridus]
MDITTEQLHYLINHIFLPPELPQEDDASPDANHILHARILEAGASFSGTLVSAEKRQEWTTVMKMLERLEPNQPSAGRLADLMGSMAIGDSLVVHIAAQNAAVILRKRHEGMIVESFEVDPPNHKIMATIGRVVCTYPHAAIGVPTATFDDASFRQELSSFLANMAVDVLPDSEAFVKKAGKKVSEYRDSASGHYITHLLHAILRGHSGAFSPDAHRTTKKVRNEIRWEDARAPWRRNPLWLVIRVAIQSVLRQTPESTDNLYKSFMVYFMAEILSTATKLDVSSELIFCIRAKIARRTTKLPASLPQIRTLASLTTAQATKTLESRWEAIQVEQQTSSHWAPATFDLERDTHLSLRTSKAYIQQRIAQVGDGTTAPQATQPAEPPRVCQTADFRSLNHPTLTSAFHGSDRDVFLALADFETSVQNHIDEWVGSGREAEDCEVIAICIKEYDAVASVRYKGDPQSQSMRLLTIFDLWVALDRLATLFHPQLKEYSPEVPADIIEPLLISKASSLERLKHVRQHLRRRHAEAKDRRTVFTDDTGPHTFSARYFAQSTELRNLYCRINADAEQSRKAKLAELERVKSEYNSLLRQARERVVCDYWKDHWGCERHSSSCDKCGLERQASAMKIAIYEWPLPSRVEEANTVVFELHLPCAFRVWRDVTAMVLGDICVKQTRKAAEIYSTLPDYNDLRSYGSRHSPRITLASHTKPFAVSHYREEHVSSATADNVCRPNALRYRLHDANRRCWAKESFPDNSRVHETCTPTLPSSSSYSPSDHTIASTLHTPNSVMASQDQAKASLNLHEHISFGGLRSGGRLQWLNIARELRLRILSFHHDEVHTLFTQAALQIGPISSESSPEWHVDLADPAFGKLLLDEIERLLLDVEDNWSNATTVQNAVLLLCRWLMSAHMHSQLVLRGVGLLREARRVTYDWLQILIPRLQDFTENVMIADFQTRICTIAAICRATYNVDPIHFHHVLANDDDVSRFIRCCIIIHDNSPTRDVDLTGPLRTVLLRDRRLSHSIEPLLKKYIQNSRIGLDSAIKAEWSGYELHGPWDFSSDQNQCWARTRTASVGGASPQIVDINIRDGRFLVDGKPLGRLPQEIVQHNTYTRLLEKKILDVIPSRLPGMDFATRRSISGAEIHFHLSPDKELIVRAVHDGSIYELIPHRTLDGDVPTLFIDDYTHWIKLGEGSRSTVEFRPHACRWKPDASNWRIQSCSWQMYRGDTRLLDIHSTTFTQCFDRVSALEEKRFLTVAVNQKSGKSPLVKVILPRYKLSFFVNENGELESVDLRSMIIDDDQSAGTFFGLSRQLVLQVKDLYVTQSIHPSRRIVLVPFGGLVPRKSGHHVRVDVRLDGRHVRYFKYEINTDLRQLKCTTLTAGFFKILLHAYTGHPLVDPLTGQTGTEEALADLHSARSFSFQNLTVEDIILLKEIASLSPCRVYYPQHLQVMETVQWGPIWPLAQHHAFYPLVQAILDFAQELLVFKSAQSSAGTMHALEQRFEPHLHARSAFATSKLFPTEFAHFARESVHDQEYFPPLDIPLRSGSQESRLAAASHATEMAVMVRAWPSRLPTILKLREKVESWAGVSADMTLKLPISYNRSFMVKGFLPPVWCHLYTRLVNERMSISSSKLMFTFAAIAYQLPEYRDLIPTLLSFASAGSAFQYRHCPNYPEHIYDFSHGLEPLEQDLRAYVAASAVSFDASSFANWPKYHNETPYKFRSRCEQAYFSERDSQVTQLVNNLRQQWPCEQPHIPYLGNLLRADDFREDVHKCFLHCFRNRAFHEHLKEVERIVNDLRGPFNSPRTLTYQLDRIPFRPIPIVRRLPFRRPSLSELLEQEPGIEFPSCPPTPRIERRCGAELVTNSSTSELQRILSDLAPGDSLAPGTQLRRRYVNSIESSRKKLDAQPDTPSFLHPTTQELESYHLECRNAFETLLQLIGSALQSHSALREAGQFPRINVRALLSQLFLGSLHPQWEAKLVALAQSFIRLQRSQRLVRFSSMKLTGDLDRELANDAFEAEEAFSCPEWLLIQIDNNFVVRPIQTKVAREMMFPASNENTISQLNMGEGKSTVIVPLITSRLADSGTLARVVVLKQLAVQMFQTLRNTLSGLLNRRVFYFPFSRDVQPGVGEAQKMQSLFELCMNQRGVWIAQPEHILSFKLMGLGLILDPNAKTENPVSTVLLRSQSWLNKHVRDVLDESDEILSVGYQLIYTSGAQVSLPADRWTTIQEILSHVDELAPTSMAALFPTDVEVHGPTTGAGFHSSIRILSEQAGDHLVQLLGRKVLQSEEYRLLSRDVIEDIFHFITRPVPDPESLARLREACERTSCWDGILLRRGLLASGILVFTLQRKRWRVNYGLDLRRTMLAVPYRAKDVPSLRTDFGHPDVAIILTCLSYYYGGLTEEQFDLCLELLLKLDNPALEYELWVRNDDQIPMALREVIGINPQDMDQRRNVLTPLFRRNLAVVNFYLRSVVFPKEAKQFRHKLSTSAWDLAERKAHLTTGFSGTNDGQWLLPTSIAQRDPLDQLSTTAKVLNFLLQAESKEYRPLPDGCTTRDFMALLVTQKPEIRVLLDVGAQMLDMQNWELAQHWLSISSTIQAVVYFDSGDNLMVLPRDGTAELLVSSSFADRLDACAVYLDDVHTRGTDLKLPLSTRAALTLGPGVTKDRLVQGAMRMRQLGYGQSVMSFAPLEVDRSIRSTCNLPHNALISSSDVIQWVMLQTISSIEHSVSPWANQGVSHQKRHAAWTRFEKDATKSIKGLQSAWVEQESRSLQEMYDFRGMEPVVHEVFELPDMARRLQDFGFSHIIDASQDEEQEREVALEVERERQVERPPPAKPATHSLHRFVRHLVETGALKTDPQAFVAPWSTIPNLASNATWSERVVATRDFVTTIQAAGFPTDYSRPVTWILSTSHGQGYLVLVSPWEANELLPLIRNSPHVHLHQYAPRTMASMRSLEDLDFNTIPASRPVPAGRWSPNEIAQLNIFAGQLYLKDFAEYTRICNMLGLYVNDEISGDGSPIQYESDGFVKPANRRGAMVEDCLFREIPLSVVKNLVGWRRKGLNYEPTHMGKILHGGLLEEKDFV